MMTKESIGVITDIEAMKMLYKELKNDKSISSKLKIRSINKKIDKMFEKIYEVGISYDLLSSLSILLKDTSYSFRIEEKSESAIIINDDNKCRFIEDGQVLDYYDIIIIFIMDDYQDIIDSYKISFSKEKNINILHKTSNKDNIISEYIFHIKDGIFINEIYDIDDDSVFIILYTIYNAVINYIKDINI